MVKNFGGNKSKKLGRKFVNQPQDRKVRFAEEVEGYETHPCKKEVTKALQVA